jgi:putative nucleotidyltransferase with HDIG domain
MKEIRTIVLFVALRSVNQRVDPALFDLDTFWAHQFCVGHAARAMAVSLEFSDPYVMYTAGLLHDMGKLFTVLMRPKDWTAICDRARIRNLPLHVAEEEYWGIDHALIGAMALRYWNLPDEITEPISWHHAPDKAPDSVVEPAVLALADTLALNQQDGGQRPIAHLLDSFDPAQGAAAVSAAQLSLEDACADRQHGVVF